MKRSVLAAAAMLALLATGCQPQSPGATGQVPAAATLASGTPGHWRWDAETQNWVWGVEGYITVPGGVAKVEPRPAGAIPRPPEGRRRPNPAD